MRVKTDGEHASGYNVELWKQDDSIYGLINVHRGLMGDPPAGILENVKFDKKTGKLSFTAKLSLGVIAGQKQDEWIPSHDSLEFTGLLSKRLLAGKLTVTEQFDSKFFVKTKKIRLPISRLWKLESFPDYESWKKYADKILEFRGPDW